jgi:hypothetical protein
MKKNSPVDYTEECMSYEEKARPRNAW